MITRLPLLVFLFSDFAVAEIPRAYHLVGAEYGVPAEVFYAVVLQESGKTYQGRFLPWPWTLNIQGKPFYYASRGEAERALRTTIYEQGVTFVGIGLGQIHWPVHHRYFTSASEALNPTDNLHYAANLLAAEYLYTIKQGRPDWWIAAGRYHHPSREDLAATYRAGVFRRCQNISNRCHVFGQPPESS